MIVRTVGRMADESSAYRYGGSGCEEPVWLNELEKETNALLLNVCVSAGTGNPYIIGCKSIC